MRGKQFRIPRYFPDNRITPADAGKTLLKKPVPLTTAGSPPRMRGKLAQCAPETCENMDHPRGCGENVLELRLFSFVPGSPPRMRGKLKDVIIEPVEIGITPADAGKTR